MVLTQILPFYDPAVLTLFRDRFEATIYSAIDARAMLYKLIDGRAQSRAMRSDIRLWVGMLLESAGRRS